MKKLLFILVSFLPHAILSQSIVINEMMSSNRSTIYDEHGDTSDWIELYNNGATQVNLEGYYLSDDSLDIKKWQFGNIVLDPGEYLLVFASDKDTVMTYWHTSFKISADGETLIFSDPDGSILDQVAIPPSLPDVSYAKKNDGNLPWIFQEPSPGTENTGIEILDYSEPVVVSLSGGFYSHSPTAP